MSTSTSTIFDAFQNSVIAVDQQLLDSRNLDADKVRTMLNWHSAFIATLKQTGVATWQNSQAGIQTQTNPTTLFSMNGHLETFPPANCIENELVAGATEALTELRIRLQEPATSSLVRNAWPEQMSAAATQACHNSAKQCVKYSSIAGNYLKDLWKRKYNGQQAVVLDPNTSTERTDLPFCSDDNRFPLFQADGTVRYVARGELATAL